MRTAEWRTPSQAQAKNAFGHENQTRFSITARLHDGHVAWCGWFDDRDDCNAFLWALARDELIRDRELWDLPTPCWHPDIGYGAPLQYTFATVAFIVSGPTWAVPSDCIGVTGQAGEFIDCIGAGASGAANRGAPNVTVGGGGGAWSRSTSGISLTPSVPVSIAVGVGGAQVTVTTNVNTAGNSGGDTSFNSGAVLAKGGVGQTGVTSPTNGGDAAAGIGQVKFRGGHGGAVTNSFSSSGGGGAAGPNGDGLNGGASSGSGVATAGGTADNGTDGVGSAGSAGATSQPGGNGTRYDATHGLGGGSGACYYGGNMTAGAGGQYGGGGGAVKNIANSGTHISGKGGEGLIVVAYVPYVQPTTPRIFDIHRRRRV